MKYLAILSAFLFTGCMSTNADIDPNHVARHEGGVIVVTAASGAKTCLKNKQSYSLYGQKSTMLNTNRYNQC